MKKLFLLLGLFTISLGSFSQKQVWTTEKANGWYQQQPWLVGCNFIPSTAINELEMWQAETFDKATIDRELGWAQGLGMNMVRVFLHYIPWQADANGFKQRINEFLLIADRHHIKPMFVLFDDCWNENPQPGKQPAPRIGIHNSGWVQCPGKAMHNDSTTWPRLELYVKDIIGSFRNDKRILLWDLYNEPGNSHYNLSTLPLLERIFQSAWSVRPSQPLTAGIWYDNQALNQFQLENSDVVSFHNYNKADDLEKQIIELSKRGRPMICSEYMARTRGSRFETHLPIFKKYKVGAVNWGFVSGKTNTIYQWDTPIPDGSEPATWFHDIYRKDGTPFDPKEVTFIKSLTATNP